MRHASEKLCLGIASIACLAVCGFMTGCASHAGPTAAQSAMNQNSESNPKPALDFDAGTKRPPTAMTIYALAQIVAAQGRDNDAEGLLKQCVAQYPEFLPAYCDLAELHLRQRRGEDAVRVLTLGLQRDPNSATMLNDLGMCRLLGGRYSDALVSFTKASGLVPGEHRYRANMATALGMLGRYDESLSLYLAILAPADAHYNVGVLCDARHDSVRAKVEYAQANTLESMNKRSPSMDVRSGNAE
jgi:Flp pilus assembly protein TadD